MPDAYTPAPGPLRCSGGFGGVFGFLLLLYKKLLFVFGIPFANRYKQALIIRFKLFSNKIIRKSIDKP